MLSVCISRNVFFANVMPSDPIRHSFRRILPKIKIIKHTNNFITKKKRPTDHRESTTWRNTASSQNYMQPSPAGNRAPVSRVTGGDTHHYTTEDKTWDIKKINRINCLSLAGDQWLHDIFIHKLLLDCIPFVISNSFLIKKWFQSFVHSFIHLVSQSVSQSVRQPVTL